MESFSLQNLEIINNEADVKDIIVEPLLKFLDYPQGSIKRKDSIQKLVITKGSKKERYRPDYIIFHEDKPVIVIEAKTPNAILEDFIYQVSGYALQLNQSFKKMNPCQIKVLTNGKYIKIFGWDEVTPIYDTAISKIDYAHLKSILGPQKVLSLFTELEQKLKNPLYNKLGFIKPTKGEISKVFFEINNYIWKKEGMKPTDAFWEFVKLFSLKMDNDKYINKKLMNNQEISMDDIFFSTNYIDKNLSLFPKQDPIKKIFNNFREELEILIIKEGKKRIFTKGEELNLSLETIKYVVKRLEKFDLNDIDEDLNGRIFEVFLRAAVRGRELGQYFTPRDVIKFMVKLAGPNENTKILDACCGSGGFLIESFAYIMNNIPKNLSKSKHEEIVKNIKENLIFGVDKEEKVVRLARINMYVHKDSSSKIFRLQDALDKNLTIDPTLPDEEQQQYKDAKEVLINGAFQIVLTNPPFSSNYKMKDKDTNKSDTRILKNYTVVGKKNSINSNILFIERYYDLLELGGKLITVIDDSLLNAKNQASFREWILDRFHIKAVISLPFNAFVNASTTIKTSIIYLEKKEYKSISKNKIFMAICNNVGHDDSGNDTPERNNLNIVYSKWLDFNKDFSLPDIIIENQNKSELLTCSLQIFSIDYSKMSSKRFDAFFYSPELQNIYKKINSLDKNKFIIKTSKEFTLQKSVNAKYVQNNFNTIFNYIEVGSCNKKGDIVSSQSNNLGNLPTRARITVKAFDIITPKLIGCLYSTCIINNDINNSLVSTGFFVFTNLSERNSYLLWSSLRSELVQKQFYYLSSTAVQPELSKEFLEKYVKIPIPINEYADAIYEDVKLCTKLRHDLDHKLNAISNNLKFDINLSFK
ncbi:N-6 DNA methylase [Rickettsia canadensis]|uniref:NAD-dependent DNA ligase LigA n=1 Tax=Rickettsia canadensis str. CA410 TaxID=1105107 RepID=A0ABN4AD03_RICCA|nr:N-6 DNA methylase [Rickettsia canadensis]AFB21427.1 NAD-dependent DNA ligase LigA [Rickettsia canadensis str. CA410]